jgi:hypothetical protein
MLKLFFWFIATAVTLPSVALAQASPMDTIDYMAKLATEFDGKTICDNKATIGELANALAEYSRAHPEKKDMLSNQDVYDALTNRFPCPFNPTTFSAVPATAENLVGHWALVPESIGLGPQIFKQNPFPSNCEYFKFDQDKSLRSIQMITPRSCPAVKPDDFSLIPKIISWKLEKASLEIRRADNPSYVEVWEPYVVTKNFVHKTVEFKPGDLLMFMAQFNEVKKNGIGNLYFRHLRPLCFGCVSNPPQPKPKSDWYVGNFEGSTSGKRAKGFSVSCSSQSQCRLSMPSGFSIEQMVPVSIDTATPQKALAQTRRAYEANPGFFEEQFKQDLAPIRSLLATSARFESCVDLDSTNTFFLCSTTDDPSAQNGAVMLRATLDLYSESACRTRLYCEYYLVPVSRK